MDSSAASDLFAMLTPTAASPDAFASAPASASDAPAGVGESEIFAHSETPPSYSHGGKGGTFNYLSVGGFSEWCGT